jgi:hypothetical protein
MLRARPSSDCSAFADVRVTQAAWNTAKRSPHQSASASPEADGTDAMQFRAPAPWRPARDNQGPGAEVFSYPPSGRPAHALVASPQFNRRRDRSVRAIHSVDDCVVHAIDGPTAGDDAPPIRYRINSVHSTDGDSTGGGSRAYDMSDSMGSHQHQRYESDDPHCY